MINKKQKKIQTNVYNDQAVLEKDGALIGSYFIIILITSILTIIILWACFTSVDEISRTRGEVIPQLKIQTIKHTQGGIVKKVYVINGELVKKGQVLLSLDPTALTVELEKSIIHVISLTANKIRHKHLLESKSITTVILLKELKKELVHPEMYNKDISLLLADRALLNRIQLLTDNREVELILKKVNQHEIELNSLLERRDMQKKLLDVISEERGLYFLLNKQDLASKRELLSVTRQYIQIKKDYLTSINEYKKQMHVVIEFKEKLKQVESNNKLETVMKINEFNAELLKTKKHVHKITDELNKLKIKATVSGIIKGLELSDGGVIDNHHPILSIVPINSKMIIETRVSSEDIGHVNINDLIKAKITTFDYIRFGTLSGKISKISASTFLDEITKEVYYKATVELDREYFIRKQHEYKIAPGMLAEVDIYTGKKTLISYLLKPVYVAINHSFTER